MDLFNFLFLLLIGSVKVIHSQQLSRCCNEGRNFFQSRSSCSGAMSASAAPTCKRASSICCLRALLDSKCEQGEKVAADSGSCPTSLLGHLGGATHKECCDCCLLAKELSSRGESCVPPAGFSAACTTVFKRCCSTPFAFTYVAATQTEVPYGTRDRCRNNNFCDHDCTDNGRTTVECSCRSGYSLDRDGRSCTEMNECSPRKPCPSGQLCSVDETGRSQCQPFNNNQQFDGMNQCAVGYISDPTSLGSCIDLNECEQFTPTCTGHHEICLNTPGSFECYCDTGFTWSATKNECIDIDECQLNIDIDCRAGTERCQNTVGSYVCKRIRNCGTGYYLDSATDTCNDIDECSRGTHDCVGKYKCRNLKGSYRCDVKTCREGMVMDRVGRCAPVDCPQGFRPSNGRCQDIDECASPRRCATFQQCINSPGSFRCVDQPNACGGGYKLDSYSGQCLDINECSDNTHSCGQGQACRNKDGGYTCDCPQGYDYNEDSRQCTDIDECARLSGSVCSLNARCENTVGSFRCHCFTGYTLSRDGVNCEDVNECDTGRATCQQRCINVPGSYQCICNRGYTLSPDGTTCEDIDECSLWQRVEEPLCMGACINTAGSYTCRCPPGYDISSDMRTCRDIDECAQGECQGEDNICVNTLGGFKCHHIRCPENYIHDPKYKNFVHWSDDGVKLAQYSESKDKCLLWKMKQIIDPVLISGESLTCKSLIQDGFFCMKKCHPSDVLCLANHTLSISTQYAALPSMDRQLAEPVEVTRVRAESLDSNPFSVTYVVDRANADKFKVTQERNIGILLLKSAIKGPREVLVRLHMNVYSRTHVLVGHNIALIHVYVSRHSFK